MGQGKSIKGVYILQKNYIIDNSDLMPKYRPDSEVTFEISDDGRLKSPDWVKSIIMLEMTVASASEDGTFGGMIKALDHAREMGVNCIWLTPIQDNRHYTNFGPHTVNKGFTGKEDYEEGFKVVKKFVDEAHKRDIRILYDIVTWGTDKAAPLFKEHPEWYTGAEEYGGWAYNWKNQEFREWFADRMVDMIMKTGADGFRADCGVRYSGYELFNKVRETLLEKGKKIAMISEPATERCGAFDFDEHSTDDTGLYLWRTGELFTVLNNIVDSVKQGKGFDLNKKQADDTAGKHRFYSSLVSCHDAKKYMVRGNLVRIAYQSILAPFIPIWYLGEEWNNPYTGYDNGKSNWLYANKIDWSLIEENREFYEKVKRTIRIRRLYPEIFEYFPENHREINIAEVETDHKASLQPYVRYTHRKGILVIPNYDEDLHNFRIVIPYELLGINKGERCAIVNLMTGKQIEEGTPQTLDFFYSEIDGNSNGVYGIAPIENGKIPFADLLEVD